nr:DUF1007 family protein [Mangrovicoccus algicola]
MRALIAAAAVAGFPAAAFAHPHAFIDASLRLETDGAGRLLAVAVDWRYGRADSHYILDARGYFDDGKITGAELRALVRDEIDWSVVPGDLSVMQGGTALPLGPLVSPSVVYEGEVLTFTHRRVLSAPAAPEAGPVEVKVYDPEFYTAYSLDEAALAAPDPACRLRVEPADLEEAGRRLGEALDAMNLSADPQDAGPGDPFPEVGAFFADAVILDCRP